MSQENENTFITKANNLNEARYKLSALEQKIILLVTSRITPEDQDFKSYEININELLDVMNLKGQSLYSEVKKVSEELLKKVLKIYNSEKNSLLLTNWFSSVEYFKKRGVVEFSFDPKLKPYLLQLKERFICYKIHNIIQLKRYYSIRIYELLKQYEKIKRRNFEVDELKEILGIEKNEYQLYGHFKSRIIEPAKKEINEKTDLTIDYEEKKEGKKVVCISFSISSKILYDPENQTEKAHDPLQELIALLPEKEREKKTVADMVSKYLLEQGFEYVSRNILYTNSSSNKSYRVFLTKSLSDDWGLPFQEEISEKEKGEIAIAKAIRAVEELQINDPDKFQDLLKDVAEHSGKDLENEHDKNQIEKDLKEKNETLYQAIYKRLSQK